MMTAFASQHDRIGDLIDQRRLQSPEIPLDGMEIFSRAQRLVKLSRAWIEPVFGRYGLDAGEFDVLATLSRSGPPYRQRPTELYQALMITSGGLTDRLSRLLAKGLIERIANHEDKRSAWVGLTSQGLDTIEAAFSEDMAVEADLLAALPWDDRRQLAGLLGALLRELENRITFDGGAAR